MHNAFFSKVNSEDKNKSVKSKEEYSREITSTLLSHVQDAYNHSKHKGEK